MRVADGWTAMALNTSSGKSSIVMKWSPGHLPPNISPVTFSLTGYHGWATGRPMIISASLPCYSHVIPVSFPCHSRVIPVSFPCHSRVIPVSFPCHSRVIPVSFPCHSRVIPVSFPCHSRVILVLFPCHSRLIPVLWLETIILLIYLL